MTQLADIYVTASMALELFRATGEARWREPMRACLRDAAAHIDAGTGLLTEMAGPDLRQYPEGRLVCVGSIFEVAWILFGILDLEPVPELENRLFHAVEAALQFGWDQDCGGFYYFQDIEGRPTLQLEWSLKLWWVHAEAICALVHCFARSRDAKWLKWLELVDRYTFERFADPVHGEWFGYLERQGSPALFLKGNHYKGCFHIPRALWLSAEKIEQCEGVKASRPIRR